MLEANGITTIVVGCAKDIIEHVGVPRFLFSDLPLGNAAGRPLDRASQAFTLSCFESDRDGAGPKNRKVSAGLERLSGLEARLLQHRAPVGRGDQAASRGI